MSGLVFSLKIWYTIDVEILQRNESCNLETSVFSVADPQKNYSVYTFAHACTGHGVGEKRYRYERNDYRCNGCSSCRSFRCNYLRTEKAHDKRLEAACNCDDLPEGGCTNDDECSCCENRKRRRYRSTAEQQLLLCRRCLLYRFRGRRSRPSRQPCTCRKKNLPTMQSRNRTIPQMMLKRRFRSLPATRTDGITFCAGLWLSIS